jgi:hypothetical protein
MGRFRWSCEVEGVCDPVVKASYVQESVGRLVVGVDSKVKAALVLRGDWWLLGMTSNEEVDDDGELLDMSVKKDEGLASTNNRRWSSAFESSQSSQNSTVVRSVIVRRRK